MNDFSVSVDCSGSRGPGAPIGVTVENWGPERAFEVVLAIQGGQTSAVTSAQVPRMGRAVVSVQVPDCFDSPRETSARVSVSPVGSDDRYEGRASFRFVPLGWFDRLDPDLSGSICRFAVDQVSQGVPARGLMEDMDEEYSALADMSPREETSDRFFQVSTPEQMREFGDCTETEAAVAVIAGMYSRGYDCTLVRLGRESYVGAAPPSPADPNTVGARWEDGVFVRPFDGCRGVGFDVSMDISAARLRHVLPMRRGPSASSVSQDDRE